MAVIVVVKRSLLIGIVLLAAFLRFYRIEAQSFWNDEGNSARIAERSLPLILEGAAGDIHPPGYYLALAAWRAALGQSEFALRALSAFAGVVLVVLVYRLGRDTFDAPSALCAACFAALHPALVYYSQEARMYALAAMWAAAVFWVAGDPGVSGGGLEKISRGRGIALALVLAAGLYTHYAFGFIVIALNLLFLIRVVRLAMTHYKLLRANLNALIRHRYLPQLAALLLFAPWLPIAIRQLTTWPAGGDTPPLLHASAGLLFWLTLGHTADPAFAILSLVGTALWSYGLLVRRRAPLPLLLWLAVPAALTLAFGLLTPAFSKFLIVAVPAVCLLMGAGLVRTFAGRDVHVLRPLLRGAVVLLIGATLASPIANALYHLYVDPAYARADYRGIDRYLDSIARPGDAILLNAPNQWEVFTYYHADPSNVFPVARARPLDVPAQLAELEAIAAAHDRLFVVYWGDAQSDPERVIESWLNAHTFKAYDRWYGDVRLAAYAVPQAATELQSRLDTAFDSRIVLEGYSLNAAAFAPGDILQLTLFWRAQTPVPERYKVFVHLVDDPAAPPAAQHDGEPGGGLALTTTWAPGETVADNHGVFIPLDLPPGSYTLRVGLYGVEDGARLRTGEGDDSQFLTDVTVR